MASTNIQTFPGKVGVSNTNPIHTLDIGSNVYIDDTAQTKLRIIGNIHASGVTVDGTITAIDSENLSVKDPIILLASGSTGTSDTGIIMKRADGDSNVAVFYDEGVGLKIGHTLSTAQDIHISVDSSNSLSTSIYGPVTVAHSSAQALVVQGGAEIADDFKVGASKLFVDVSASNVGIGTDAPLATLDVHGTANVGALTVVSISGDGSGLSSIQSSNVSDFASNVTRIGTLETDLGSNVTRIGTLETDLGSNVTRIGTLETDLGSNVTRIGTLETDLGSNVTRITNLESSDMTIGGEKTFSSSLTVGGDVTVTDTTSGSAAGPEFSLYRNQTGTNGDYLGQLRFDGKHDGGNDQLYAKITGKIKKADQGGEDGVIETAIITDGSQRVSLRHTGDLFHIKNGTDLQVGETANLYVDTATSRVGVNTSSPAYTLDVHGTAAIVSEQPPAALTGDSTVVDGHGRYKVTSSGMLGSNYDYNIFSKNETDTWISLTNTFNVDGTHAGSESLGGVSGEWVKLEMPYKTTLRHFTLRHDIDNTTLGQRRQFPVDFKIVASNDDTNWQTLNTTTGVSTPEASDPALTFVVNASASYKFYAIVVEKITSGAAFNRCHIGELRLFTETFTVDAGKVNMTAASGLDVGYTEHPVEAFTGSTTYNANIGSNGEFQPSTHYVEGHGTYEAWASTQYNASGQDTREVWKLFDTGSDYWGSALTGAFETYNSSSPYEYVGTRDTTTTDVGGTRYKGVFVQLKMPYAITLAYTDIYRAIIANNPNRAPGAGVFFGSNDGEHWYKLTEFSGASYASDDKERITLNATTPYQYYRFVITNIVGGNSQTSTLFSQWRLFAEKPVTRMENVHISGDLSSETLQTGYIKWPRKSLKANESEGYVASASNVYNTSVTTAPYTAFNNYREVKSNGYADAFVGGNGDFTAGVANKSRTTGGDTFNHEWLQIQMPRAIKLSHFTLLQRVKNVDNDNDMPKNGRMYGSNDGVSWTKLVTFSNLTYERYEETRVDVKSTTPYSYYRLAVTETVGSSQVYVAVGELQLFEAATGVGAAPTSAKLQVAGSLGMAKGSEFFAGDDVVMELPKHDRPLTRYPEFALTANTDRGYIVNRSSIFSFDWEGYKAFNRQRGTNLDWISASTYTSGVYGGSQKITDVNGTDYDGEWIKLQLPKAIRLEKFSLVDRDGADFTRRLPKDGTLLGSNDGTGWEVIHTWTGRTFITDIDNWFHVNSTKYYKHFGLVAEALKNDAGATSWDMGEIKYYGTEEGDTSVDVVHRSIPNKPGQQHLEVYWDANDSNSYSFADSSSVYDLSGSGVTGTITGNNGFDAEYNAWVFDGSGDYISTTSSGLGTGGAFDHSFAFWFKINRNITNNDYVVTFGEETNDNMIAVNISGNTLIHFDNWGRGVITGDIVRLGTWYHVACTHTGSATGDINNQLIYVNGVRQTTSATGTGTLAFTSNKITIGARPGGGTPTAFLDGAVSNVRFFKGKALNADQVRELYEYDAERFGHRQNLVSLHKGNLGVGVTHPTFRFEVAGTETLQEYPPRAIRVFDYDTHIESHGVFNFYSSQSHNTYFNNSSWNFTRVFANGITDRSTAWHGDGDVSSPGLYQAVAVYAPAVTSGDGVRKSTLKDGSVFFGEWIEMHSPSAINITNVVINARQNYGKSRGIGKFVILGSNDGHSWEQAGYGAVAPHDNSSSTDAGGYGVLSDEKATKVSTNSNGRFYTHHRLVVTHIMGNLAATNHVQYVSGRIDLVNVAYLRFLGTPAPSSLEDGHLTLGKALTLPRVSGHPAGAETPRAESLVVHYDTTVDSVVSGSTAVDISGEGNNGTFNGNASYSSTDRALVFDGSGDYIESGNIGFSGDQVMSVSFWFRYNSVPSGRQDLFGVGKSGTALQFGLATYTPGTYLYTGGNDIYNTGYNIVTDTEWHHVVAIYTGGTPSTTTMSLYVDNVNVVDKLTTSSASQALNLDSTNCDVVIGVNQSNAAYLNGQISNFKLYDVALTAEEVAMEYALGRTGKSLNLTDTALCLGGTVPRAQLDVRGGALVGGNVGIGLTSPAFTLDVNGVSRSRGVCVNSGFGNGTARPALTTGSTHPSYEIRSIGGNGNVGGAGADDGFLRLRAGGGTGTNSASYIDLSGYSTYSGGDMKRNIVFGTLGTERMRIKENGNVGIGTANPSGALHVNGENIYISSAVVSNCTWRIMPQTGNATKLFRIYDDDNASDRLVIDASGNVGIGTTNPTSKLHIETSSTSSGTFMRVDASSVTNTGYSEIQMIGPGQTSQGLSMFCNGSGRTSDGGASATTVRNNNGPIILGNSSYVNRIRKPKDDDFICGKWTTTLDASAATTVITNLRSCVSTPSAGGTNMSGNIGRFTAPEDGYYFACCQVDNAARNNSNLLIIYEAGGTDFATNNPDVGTYSEIIDLRSADNVEETYNKVFVMHMKQNNYIQFRVHSSGYIESSSRKMQCYAYLLNRI